MTPRDVRLRNVFGAGLLVVTLAGCTREKPPPETDVKSAVQTHLRQGGLSTGRAFADRRCSSEFVSDTVCRVGHFGDSAEWVGGVREVTRVVEIENSQKETILTTRTNRYGASSPDTTDITVWTVKVELLLECICRDRGGPVEGIERRPLTATHDFRLRYMDGSDKPYWTVHD